MADNASYEILVPYLGTGVAAATAKHLSLQLQGAVHIAPRRNVYMDGSFQNYEPVSIITEDTPHADSTVKQAAAYVAEVVGSGSIIVSKHGKDGITTWPIRNTASPPGPRSSPAG
jgi:hypothetical protein